jgi:hypothetical protein
LTTENYTDYSKTLWLLEDRIFGCQRADGPTRGPLTFTWWG